jgi:hypothetical protein
LDCAVADHGRRRSSRTGGLFLSSLRIFVGDIFSDLLVCLPMISGLLTIGILWHAIQSFPGFLETVGYLFGMLAAAFTLEAYWQSDME